MSTHLPLALGKLLGSLVLLGLGWWLRHRIWPAGAVALVATGGVLAVVFAVGLLRRIADGTRQRPMD